MTMFPLSIHFAGQRGVPWQNQSSRRDVMRFPPLSIHSAATKRGLTRSTPSFSLFPLHLMLNSAHLTNIVIEFCSLIRNELPANVSILLLRNFPTSSSFSARVRRHLEPRSFRPLHWLTIYIYIYISVENFTYVCHILPPLPLAPALSRTKETGAAPPRAITGW